MPVDFKYRAFISYSHADHDTAVWLHKALEKYPIHKKLVGVETSAGKTPRRIGRVFRDEAELGAVPELGSKIEAALNSSDTLIVICSPSAAKSQWVEQEITHFKGIGRQHRVLALILDGEPNAPNPDINCFPDALNTNPDGSPAQPLAVDVRKFGREDAVVRLVSGILDLEYDDLKQRDLQRKRAEMRRAQTLFVAGLTLLISALGAGYLALKGFADLAHARSDIIAREAKIIYDEGNGDKAKSLLMALQADPSARRTPISQFFSGLNGYPLARARLIAAQSNGRLRRIIYAHAEEADAIAYAPNGGTMVTASWEGEAKIWDVATGNLLQTISGDRDFASEVAFSPDGEHIYFAAERTIHVWTRGSQGLRTITTEHTASIVDLAVSKDGQYLASASWDGTSKVWNLPSETLHLTLTDHIDAVGAIAFDPDSQTIATGSGETGQGIVKIWDLATGQMVRSFEGHTDIITALAYAPDGGTLVSGGGDNVIRQWDLDGQNYDNILTGHTDVVMTAAFSPDGAFLVTGSADNTIRIWNTFSGNLHAVLGGHTDPIQEIRFAPDGSHFASASSDGTVRMWAPMTGDIISTLTRRNDEDGSGPARSISFTPDAQSVLTGSEDPSALLWDVSTGAVRKRFESDSGNINAVAVAPSGATFAAGFDDTTVKIIDLESGRPLRTFIGHTARITAVAYSPDGAVLVSGGDDGSLNIWDTEIGNLVAMPSPVTASVESIAFAPDGRSFTIVTNAGEATIFDAATGASGQTLHSSSLNDVWSVAYAPDGASIITGTMEGKIKEVELPSQALRKTYTDAIEWIWAMDYAPNGQTMVSASGYTNSGAVKLWDTLTGEMLTDLSGDLDHPNRVAFSPDGRSIIVDNAIGWDEAVAGEIWKVPDIVLATPRQQVELACNMLWRANAPLHFTAADAQDHPVLTGEPTDPETGNFKSPCKGVLPETAFLSPN